MSELPASRLHLSAVCGPLLRPVVARFLAAVAARMDLPVDRIADLLLIGDALAAAAPANVADARLELDVMAGTGGLELVVGPLRSGGAGALVADTEVPGLGDVLGRLADDVRTVGGADGDRLRLQLDALASA